MGFGVLILFICKKMNDDDGDDINNLSYRAD